MKNKFLTVIFLLFIFFIFVFVNRKDKINSYYKVLKVVEADWFYIDFNKNNLVEEDELVKVKNINAFSPVQNKYSKEKSIKLGISILEYLKAGFLARNWAKDNLVNSDVLVKSKVKNLKYNAYIVEIDYEGVDLGEYLLKNGLAYTNSDCNNVEYLPIQNIRQVRNNAKELNSLEFLILNLKSGVVHIPSCEYAKMMSDGELILRKTLKDVVHYCKFCFGNNFKENNDVVFKIPKSKNAYKKSVYKNFGYFELYLINPLEYSKPNYDCNSIFAKRLIKEIDSANNSIDIAMYAIGEQKEIVEALRRARKRGVKIRSVLDYSKNMSEIYPETMEFAKEFDSHFDRTQILMHNKIFIFDEKKVITGSVNISSTDSGGYNGNIALVFNSSEVAKYYKQEFSQMHEGKFSKRKEKINSYPIKMGNALIRLFFMPKSNVNEEYIIPALKAAKSEIFVSAFYLTDLKIITELIGAKKRGLDVIVLLDALGASNFKKRIVEMRNLSIPVKVENWGGKNHEKTILIDERILITGSSNFSASGLYKNDENVVVIENSEIASLYRDYFLYLFNSINDKFLRAFPRAEGWESINSCHDGIDNNHDEKIDLDDDGCRVYK